MKVKCQECKTVFVLRNRIAMDEARCPNNFHHHVRKFKGSLPDDCQYQIGATSKCVKQTLIDPKKSADTRIYRRALGRVYAM